MKEHIKHNNDFLIIGKAKYEIKNYKFGETKKLIKPNNRFRILVQHRPTNEDHSMRSIMVYDFTGKATVDNVMKKIKKLLGDKTK